MLNQWEVWCYHLLDVGLAVSIDRFINSCKAFSLASISDISAEWSNGPESKHKKSKNVITKDLYTVF